MLWVMESAREGLELRKYFNFHVIPSESIRATIDENIVTTHHYRAARSSILKAYESRLDKDDIENVFKLSSNKLTPTEYLQMNRTQTQQKRFVLEASAEFVEYDYQKKDINSTIYKERLYTILNARSSLGRGEIIDIPTPTDPMLSHRSFKVSAEIGVRNSQPIAFMGVRPANHAIEDFDIGFLDGTQIEFMDLLFSYTQDDNFKVEKATLFSVEALSPRSDFFKPQSWRLSIGFNRDYLSQKTDFSANYSMGATWGGDFGYVYFLVDALAYVDSSLEVGVGGVIGGVIRQGDNFKTNIEATQRIYYGNLTQGLFSLSQSYRPSQNSALSLSYDYVEKFEEDWNTLKLSFDYFF